jgi:hypothetical protein
MLADSACATGRGLAGAELKAGVATDARCGVTREDQGCFIRIMIVAAIFLGVGWFFGGFLIAPVHCGSPNCAWGYQRLQPATLSSFAGMGCLALAAVNKLPRLFLPLGAGVLGYTALTSIGSIGTIILVGVDFLLVVGAIGWLLMTWWGK